MTQKQNRRVIKNDYVHHQISGYLSVKQYAITTVNDRRCLILRFSNEMQSVISRVEFTVIQLDAEGSVIGKSKIKYENVKIAPRQLYCSEEAVLIKRECADFVVRIRYIISDDIKYVFKKDHVTAHYDTRGFGHKNKQTLGPRIVAIRRSTFGSGAFFGLMALLSFAISIGALFATSFL